MTVALVTGAGSGIGEASARRLAADGAQVVVVDIDGDRAQRVAAEIDGLAVTADVSNEEGVDHYMAAALERYGRVDHHHLNAGIIGSFAPFAELTADEFDQVIGVNLRGVFLGLRAAFRAYERQHSGGAIVVTASINGLRGSADLIPYHASKHGVIGLTRCAALTGGPLGVRVNAVAPGIVLTGLFAQSGDVTGGGSDAVQRARNSALGRPGEVEEIAALVAWLLSDEASFMTGEILSIDGGATALNPARPSGQPAQ
jgi:NAD(P)-dependent dehydrogenase (short-subunit alcohol dehydrogenase family)